MTMALWDLLERSARNHSGRICVSFGGKEYPFSEIKDLATRFSGVLSCSGIRAQDKVVTLMQNSPGYIIAFFALMRLGAVCVPLSTQLVKEEISTIINRCSPALAIADEAGIALVPPGFPVIPVDGMFGNTATEPPAVASAQDNALAMIIYTSGTTSLPKGVMLTHANLVSNARAICDYLRLTPADSVMAVMPFSFSYGHSLITTHVMAGARLVIENSFVYPAYVMKRMRDEQVTGFSGVPAHYMLLRKCCGAFDLPSLRYFTNSAGSLSWTVVEEFVKAYPHAQFFYMYGQTEAAPRLSYLDPSLVLKKKGSIGRGIGGVRLEVLTDDGKPVKPGELGQITAQGPNIMAGYFNDPAGTAAVIRDGRLYTGDLGTVDEDGYIYIIAREKAIIKSGAYRISPAEIETTVLRIPGVSECAVVGVADDILGEAVKVFIIRDNDCPDAGQVISYCRDSLAAYKVPKFVEFVDSFPRTSSGKIQIKKLGVWNAQANI